MLTLSSERRSRCRTTSAPDIAAELLASLDEAVDEPETVQTLWSEELEERTERVLSGQVAEEDWGSVRQRIANELTG